MNVEYIVKYYDMVQWQYHTFKSLSAVVTFYKIYQTFYPKSLRSFRVYKFIYCME